MFERNMLELLDVGQLARWGHAVFLRRNWYPTMQSIFLVKAYNFEARAAAIFNDTGNLKITCPWPNHILL